MAPIARRKALAAVGCFVAWVRTLPAHAANGTSDPMRFAIVGPASDDATSEGGSWREIAKGIAADLIASGRFVQIESDLSRESANIDVVPDFNKWRSTQAEWLIVGRATKRDQRLKVTFRLWYVANGQQALGQQYVISQDDLQRIPHIMAQAISEQLTGAHDRSDGNQQK